MHPHVVHAMAAAVIIHPHVLRAVITLHVHAARVAIRAFRAATAALLARKNRRKPKISVITPTWQRHRLLADRCIPSVAAQTYEGEIEHVVVSDGPDPALEGVPGVRFLPEHREQPNRGIWARLAGTRLATGDLIAYLDDDNAWRPQHLELLQAAIQREDVSFAYSRAQCSNDIGTRWEVGCRKPVFGQIDTSLIVHNAGLLEVATWQPSGTPADWDLVSRWLDAGATWAHVPVITLDYYARMPPMTEHEIREFRRCYARVVPETA
jgi:glycosyltransferase involved in cell wall biosynthesis